MSAHLFVDESKRRGLVLVSVSVPSADLRATRRSMSALAMPRQRRVHFTTERTSRKKQILEVIGGLGISATVYVANAETELDGRRACLDRIVADHPAATRLVIERDDSLVSHDRQVVFDAVRKHGSGLNYVHLRAHEECLLWIPDALAWCWSADGQWRAGVRELLTVVDVGP